MNLTYDQQEKLKNGTKIDREVMRYFDEKKGSSNGLLYWIALDQRAMNRKQCWAGAKF